MLLEGRKRLGGEARSALSWPSSENDVKRATASSWAATWAVR